MNRNENRAKTYSPPFVKIEDGPKNWQILQQNEKGTADITLSGTWELCRIRKKPNVTVRIVKEGGYSAISNALDWKEAKTTVNQKGKKAGRVGTWEITIKNLPAGGPYRLETSIGCSEDAVEWRPGGDMIHFLCVGDIWLIAGQSNADGTSKSPIDDPSEIGVHQFSHDYCWEIAAHGNRHHPWLAFAKSLKKELGYPIAIIPTAVGGTEIARWTTGPKGDLFRRMKDRVIEAGGKVKGVLWYQGESDCNPKDYPKYKARFSSLLKGMRKFTGNKELPVITVQLNRVLSGLNSNEWEKIREIQRQISHEQKNVFVFSAFDSVLCDGIHNGSLGQILISQRAVDTALGGIYGKDINFRHPECIESKQISKTTIDLKFENILSRLDFMGRTDLHFPFAVRDKNGEVPIKDFSIPKKDVFRLELERPLEGKATVTGAPGSYPPHMVPKDINGYRPMLGFTMEVSN